MSAFLPIGSNRGERMFARTLASAIDTARLSQLDDLSRSIWKAFSAGSVSEFEAGRLSEAIEARRSAHKASLTTEKPSRRRNGSRPRSAASLDRRRRWVASGLMPPQIACQFTMGEAAALGVIAAEMKKRGDCRLTIGEIAGTAGVCATTVRNALRQARKLGFLTVEERRIRWTRNLSNVVKIVSEEWKTWLKLGRKVGGCKTVKGTPTQIKTSTFSPFKKASTRVKNQALNLETGANPKGSVRDRHSKGPTAQFRPSS